MINATEYLKFFIALLMVVDPLGAIPIFLSLTPRFSAQERVGVARIATVTVVLVLAASCLMGEFVLRLFNISIASFRVGGGILILLMAVAMIQVQPIRSKHTPEEAEEAAEKTNLGVVPLAVPLLAGPGAISMMIIYTNQGTTWLHQGALIAASAGVGAVLWAALRLAVPISRMLGQTGINIVVRLMGLLVAAIAVEFITDGLAELLPGLQ